MDLILHSVWLWKLSFLWAIETRSLLITAAIIIFGYSLLQQKMKRQKLLLNISITFKTFSVLAYVEGLPMPSSSSFLTCFKKAKKRIRKVYKSWKTLWEVKWALPPSACSWKKIILYHLHYSTYLKISIQNALQIPLYQYLGFTSGQRNSASLCSEMHIL